MSNKPLHTRGTVHTLTRQLGVASLVRLCLNTAIRFPYPFAPALGRGLGVSTAAITSLLATEQFSGMFTVASGPLSDRWGRRRLMVAGSGLLAGGMLLGAVLPTFGGVLLALFLAGLGKSAFDPAIQAYVGERVPYERRGRVVGLMEFAWAGSLLLGIPLVALLIDRFGWRSPFFVLAGAGLLGVVALVTLFPSDFHQRPDARNTMSFGLAWRRLSREPVALFALAYGFLASAANLNLFVVYGVWMEEAFGLSIVALGTATLVIGFGELLGEGLTASIADRVGLKRAVIAGSVVLVFGYALLPWAGRSLLSALAGLFITFVAFEFTIVTFMTVCTEILPGARATMVSGHLAANSLGRVLGAALGGLVWLAGGLTANGQVSALIAGLALVCLLWGLRDWRAESS